MSELRGEFAELRGELKGDIGTLRAEFGKLEGQFGELRGEFGELRGDVDQHLAGLRGEIAGQNRLFYFAIVTTVVGIIALVISAFFAAWAV